MYAHLCGVEFGVNSVLVEPRVLFLPFVVWSFHHVHANTTHGISTPSVVVRER